MELTEAVRGRRSATRLTSPAPSDGEICELLAAAANGPDHGLLSPWRLVLVRGAARELLGAAFAADLPENDVSGRLRAAAKPLRAPLLLSFVCAPKEAPKVPDWEQMAAAVIVVYSMTLLLHERGWGTMWRTGPASRSASVRDLLGIGPREQLLGWLYVGTPSADRPAPRRRPNVLEQTFVLGTDRTIGPVACTAAMT